MLVLTEIFSAEAVTLALAELPDTEVEVDVEIFGFFIIFFFTITFFWAGITGLDGRHFGSTPLYLSELSAVIISSVSLGTIVFPGGGATIMLLVLEGEVVWV